MACATAKQYQPRRCQVCCRRRTTREPSQGLPPTSAPRFDQLRARIAALATPHLEFTLALLAIVDEAVLHRVVGCGAVMRVQLKQISTMIYLPNVTIQVVPFAMGAHPAMDSKFNILEFDSAAPSVVYVEGP